MKTHKHKWAISHWCGDTIGYRCQTCNIRFERKMDKTEIAYVKRTMSLTCDKDNVHRVWHSAPLPDGWESCRQADEKIKIGQDMEKFAKKHPEQVIMLSCDDSYHASSDLVLVTHEAERRWMGVTVLMFPQCDGREPAHFFLYPGSVDHLIKELQKIRKRAKDKSALEYKDAEKRNKWWNNRIKIHPAPKM